MPEVQSPLRVDEPGRRRGERSLTPQDLVEREAFPKTPFTPARNTERAKGCLRSKACTSRTARRRRNDGTERVTPPARESLFAGCWRVGGFSVFASAFADTTPFDRTAP